MTILFGVDQDSFESVLILARFPVDEFVATATTVPSSLNLPSDLLSGWVTVRRRSTGTARTYNAGSGFDWLAYFKRDLVSGIFGSPCNSSRTA